MTKKSNFLYQVAKSSFVLPLIDKTHIFQFGGTRSLCAQVENTADLEWHRERGLICQECFDILTILDD